MLQVFLNIIGKKAYVTPRSLLLPKTPTEVKHEDAKKVLVELKNLTATCSFGTFLQEALRDCLIAVLRSDTIWCHLLAFPDDEVTWCRVCKVATTMEAAQKVTQDMLSNNAGIGDAELYW
ncbi:hypothetical protein MRX96_046636 [Rhipicephalus microplus]